LLTQERLKIVLNYDPDTGLFTRRITLSSRAKAGQICSGMHCEGYLRISIDYERYLAHRLVWLYVYGEWPEYMIDHINGNRQDNRLCNLREATNSQNLCNQGKPANNTSGYKGVYYDKERDKWVSEIKVRKMKTFLGRFDSAEAASDAYNRAAIKLHGEFTHSSITG